MAKALVITEKPSVARDVVQALGGFTEHDGYWESDSHLVTFAVGHLFELLEPEEIDPKYKRWTLADLPVIPPSYQLKKKKGQTDRIRTIEKLLARKDVDQLVNACDAGREGELIFREIVKFLGSRKPIQRLWLQSMTPNAIREGFRHLRPDAELLGLAAAAECRAYSDWLIGMNATRALTKRLKSRREKTAWSAGRVQTPTLALLVEREAEVLAHVPRPFWRLVGQFEREGAGWTGTWFDPAFAAGDDDERRDDRIFEEARAREIARAVEGREGAARETRKPSREASPPLFDLTSLQREGNRRFGWSARRTLSAAQRCYEAHKLLTYPRTDSRCLPSDYRAVVDDVLRAYSGAAGARAEGAAEFAPHAQRLLERGLENTGRIFDDGKVSDHFAIIPTGALPSAALSGDDRRLFDLVMRRFLGAFHPPALWERVERITEVADHSFRTRARTLMEPGWREVLPAPAGADDEETAVLPPLAPGKSEASGVPAALRSAELQAEETRPPARLSEARLLSLMENAGQDLEDEDLAAALHEKGIGTPATRAEIIENLIAKGYAVRLGKALRPTVKGIRLIDTLKRVHIDRLASAALTGEIEQHLLEVEKGRRTQEAFLAEMEDYAREIVDVARSFEYEQIYGGLPPARPVSVLRPRRLRAGLVLPLRRGARARPGLSHAPVEGHLGPLPRPRRRDRAPAGRPHRHPRRLHRPRWAHLPRPPRDRPRELEGRGAQRGLDRRGRERAARVRGQPRAPRALPDLRRERRGRDDDPVRLRGPAEGPGREGGAQRRREARRDASRGARDEGLRLGAPAHRVQARDHARRGAALPAQRPHRAADRLHLAVRTPVLGRALLEGERPPRLRVPAPRPGRRRRRCEGRGGGRRGTQAAGARAGARGLRARCRAGGRGRSRAQDAPAPRRARGGAPARKRREEQGRAHRAPHPPQGGRRIRRVRIPTRGLSPPDALRRDEPTSLSLARCSRRAAVCLTTRCGTPRVAPAPQRICVVFAEAFRV